MMTRTQKAVYALVGLALVLIGVGVGMTISEPMTSFGRLFVAANLIGVLVVLVLIWRLIRRV